ncbi:MAG TPA: hypothetical protein VF880_11545 [Actinomycetes bacterium]
MAAVAVAAALALLPLAQVDGPLRAALAWLAVLGLLLAAGAAWPLPLLLAPALLALLAEHALVVLGRGDRLDATAPLVGAGLLLYAELACWAQEARPAVHDEWEVIRTRLAVLGACLAGALGLGALLLLASGVPAGGGLTRLAVGVVAATLTLGLVAAVARRTATRPR